MPVLLVPGTYPGGSLDDLLCAVEKHNTMLNKTHYVQERTPNRIFIVCSEGKHICAFRAVGATSGDGQGITVTQFFQHDCHQLEAARNSRNGTRVKQEFGFGLKNQKGKSLSSHYLPPAVQLEIDKKRKFDATNGPILLSNAGMGMGIDMGIMAGMGMPGGTMVPSGSMGNMNNTNNGNKRGRVKVENTVNNNILFRKQIRNVEGELLKAQAELKTTTAKLNKTELVLQNTSERVVRAEVQLSSQNTEIRTLRTYVGILMDEMKTVQQHIQQKGSKGSRAATRSTPASKKQKNPSNNNTQNKKIQASQAQQIVKRNTRAAQITQAQAKKTQVSQAQPRAASIPKVPIPPQFQAKATNVPLAQLIKVSNAPQAQPKAQSTQSNIPIEDEKTANAPQAEPKIGGVPYGASAPPEQPKVLPMVPKVANENSKS